MPVVIKSCCPPVVKATTDIVWCCVICVCTASAIPRWHQMCTVCHHLMAPDVYQLPSPDGPRCVPSAIAWLQQMCTASAIARWQLMCTAPAIARCLQQSWRHRLPKTCVNNIVNFVNIDPINLFIYTYIGISIHMMNNIFIFKSYYMVFIY